MIGLGVASVVAKALQEREPRTANTNEGRNEVQAPLEVSSLPLLWDDEHQSLTIESLRLASLLAYQRHCHQGLSISKTGVSNSKRGTSVHYQQDRCLE